MPALSLSLGYHFIDPSDGIPRQLRFQTAEHTGHAHTIQAATPHAASRDAHGQLIAIVADPRRHDNGQAVPISRADVSYGAISRALQGWSTWASIWENIINLAEIRRRIQAAGLD